MDYINFVCRVTLAVVFVAAAVGKARSSHTFLATVEKIGVPLRIAPIAVWAVVAFEAIVSGLLASGGLPFWTSVSAGVILIVFAGISIVAIGAHWEISCHCFGESGTLLGYETLWRSLLLLLLSTVYTSTLGSGKAVWWPHSLGTAVVMFGLVVAVILLGRWLLASGTLVRLIIQRRMASRMMTGDPRLQRVALPEGMR